jgi:hypothetical protein
VNLTVPAQVGILGHLATEATTRRSLRMQATAFQRGGRTDFRRATSASVVAHLSAKEAAKRLKTNDWSGPAT